MLRVIAILLIVYLVVSRLLRLFFGTSSAGANGRQQAYSQARTQNNGGGHKAHRGNINIQYVRDSGPSKRKQKEKPHTKDGAGEYIDYEEVN